jgi:hypothetical protein
LAAFAPYQFPNDLAFREWEHHQKYGEHHPHMLDETTAKSQSRASGRANIRSANHVKSGSSVQITRE